jgi:hypothetical protein
VAKLCVKGSMRRYVDKRSYYTTVSHSTLRSAVQLRPVGQQNLQ